MTSLPEPEFRGEPRRFSPRTEQLIEVGVFLFLIVPSMLVSLFVVQRGNLSFVLTAVSTIFRDLGLVSLILFFLWRNGEPLRRIGWTFHRAWSEVLLGIGLFIPTFLVAGFFDQILRAVGFSPPSAPLPSFLTPSGPSQVALAVILVAIVAVAEETIFRGYLVRRFESAVTGTAGSILLSSVVFALGHGYEGGAGVLTVGLIGVIFALVYVWRRSLVAPMTMHFLQDFVGIVLVPLLLHR